MLPESYAIDIISVLANVRWQLWTVSDAQTTRKGLFSIEFCTSYGHFML